MKFVIQDLNKITKEAIKQVARDGGYAYIFDTSMGATLYDEGGDDIMPLVKKKLGL